MKRKVIRKQEVILKNLDRKTNSPNHYYGNVWEYENMDADNTNSTGWETADISQRHH